MTQSIPIETYITLEKEFGQAIAERVTSLLDYSFAQADKKIEQIAIQKKLELKDELSKELANKGDIALLKSDIALLRADFALIESKLDKKIVVWSVIIIAVVIITNINSLQFIAKIAGLIK